MKEELGCGSDGRMRTALGIKASAQAFGGHFQSITMILLEMSDVTYEDSGVVSCRGRCWW